MVDSLDVGDFPIDLIRNQFPSLNRIIDGRSIAFFDGPSGSQIVGSAINAIVDYLSYHNANHGGKYPTSEETEAIVEEGRKAMGDFLNAKPQEIAFGQNMTSLIYMVAGAISKTWKKGDEILLTEIDHRAHVDPYMQFARERGVEVKWIPLDVETYTLDYTDLDHLINENTKLIAIGHASNGLGTINDVKTVVGHAKEHSTLVSLDAVHSAPHISVDMEKLGADFTFCSAYKFYGPHLGIVGIKEKVFEELDVYRVAPAPLNHPGKLETGTQNHEGIAATTASVNFFASLGSGYTRKDKIKNAFDRIHNYENKLANYLRNELKKLPNVILYQAEEHISKAPTVAFNLENRSPSEVCERLSKEFTVFAGGGHFYALTIGDLLQLNNSGGWIRTGLSVYTSPNDVQRLIDAIKMISS